MGQALAAQGQGTCQVVMVLDSTLDMRSPTRPKARTPLTPEVIARAGRKLADLYGPDISTLVLPGNPVKEVRRFAQNHSVDLIVMSQQALRIEQNYGEKLAAHAPCTVMIVIPPTSESQPPSTPKKSPQER